MMLPTTEPMLRALTIFRFETIVLKHPPLRFILRPGVCDPQFFPHRENLGDGKKSYQGGYNCNTSGEDIVVDKTGDTQDRAVPDRAYQNPEHPADQPLGDGPRRQPRHDRDTEHGDPEHLGRTELHRDPGKGRGEYNHYQHSEQPADK